MKLKDFFAKAIIITFIGVGFLALTALAIPFLIFFGIPLAALIWALDHRYNLRANLTSLSSRTSRGSNPSAKTNQRPFQRLPGMRGVPDSDQ